MVTPDAPPPRAGRLETGRGKCRSCRAPVAWARTQRGKMIPLDPNPVPLGNVEVTGTDESGRGPVLLATVHGDSIAGRAERHTVEHRGGSLYVAHFTTCPNAAAHRGGGS